MTTPTPAADDLTVVIPAHNAEATLAEAIRSVVSTHRPAPTVIVVDDRSTDRTAEVAAAAGATVVSAIGTGPGAARNTGVRLVGTKLLAFCDADDQWHDGRLDEHLSCLADPAIDLVLGRTRYRVDEADPDIAVGLLAGHRFERDDATAVIPHFGAVTMRTEVFGRVGPIDESLDNFEDYEWCYRARDLGVAMLTSDRVAQIRRITATSTSRLNQPTPADLLAVIHRSVRRRRLLGLPAEAPSISTLGR